MPLNPAIQNAITSGLTSLKAPPVMRLSQWAAEHFYLSAESSYVEKRWESYPYQTAILDLFSNDEIEEVVVKKSARVGYTKMILAAQAYYAHHKRRNQAIWQPTDEDADDYVKTEIDTMLRDVRAMHAVFPAHLQRHKDNTLKQKKFLGSILHIRGGKAAKNYRRLTVDTGYLDEVDGFDQDIEKEGDPFTLAKKRTEGATFPKMIVGSTPKLRHFSHVEFRYDSAEKRLAFYVPCPHCDAEIVLRWGGRDKNYGLKWIDRDPETAAYLCEHCSSLFPQKDYLSVWHRGRWKSDDGTWIDESGEFRDAENNIVKPPKSVGVHIWTINSPQATWASIVDEFLKANDKAKTGDKSKLKTFTNTTLGETWEEEIESTDQNELKKRAEDYPLRIVPRGALVLVAGVDVQSNRFEIVLWGIGVGEEMWPVDYTVLDANPADERDWQKLDDYLLSTFPHACGTTLKIEAAAIDTGGHYTHQAYNFCRVRTKRRIFAIKGDTQQGRPVKGRSSNQDVNHNGKIIKRGVKLWLVGTDTAKDLLSGRLKVTQPGPGYVHFSKHLPDEFYNQLTAEARILAKTSSGEQYRWVKQKGRTRNEVLDCTVYAIFCAHALDLHRYTLAMWEKLKTIIQPVQADLFVPNIPASNEETKAPINAVVANTQNTANAIRRRPRVVRG